MKDNCKKCGDKLDKKEDDALFYCMKCNEDQKNTDNWD